MRMIVFVICARILQKRIFKWIIIIPGHVQKKFELD